MCFCVANLGTDMSKTACIVIVNLESMHPLARGYRKGFINYPYAYLSPGEFNVPARINVDTFSIASADVLDLDRYDTSLGGYSGGFSDGDWACFW